MDPFGDGKSAIRIGGGILLQSAPGCRDARQPVLQSAGDLHADQILRHGRARPATAGLAVAEQLLARHRPARQDRDAYHATSASSGASAGAPWWKWPTWARSAAISAPTSKSNSCPTGRSSCRRTRIRKRRHAAQRQLLPPLPRLRQHSEQVFESNSSYHSLQIQANRRCRQGHLVRRQLHAVQSPGLHRWRQHDRQQRHQPAADYLNAESGTTARRATIARTWCASISCSDVPRLSKVLTEQSVREALFDGWQISRNHQFPQRPSAGHHHGHLADRELRRRRRRCASADGRQSRICPRTSRHSIASSTWRRSPSRSGSTRRSAPRAAARR